MRAALVFAAALALTGGGCGGKSDPGGTGKGGSGGGSVTTTSCLDQPGAVPSPPRAGLPCELIPPGLELSTTH
jgi:hypothetical protein